MADFAPQAGLEPSREDRGDNPAYMAGAKETDVWIPAFAGKTDPHISPNYGTRLFIKLK
jgi:hypothetical protein